MKNRYFATFGHLLAGSLVKQILLGLVAGILLAHFSTQLAQSVGILGKLFVGALKSVAPLLVFVLVISAISSHRVGQKSNIRPIVVLYLFSTLFAALVAVTCSKIWPQYLTLPIDKPVTSHPSGIIQVLEGLLLNLVVNPIDALIKANYIGILLWSVGLGLAFRHSSASTRAMIDDTAQALTWVVNCVIRCAPLGIFGLVASTLSSEIGFSALQQYINLLMLLLGCMLLMALVFNPILVYWKIRRNPYPLVFTCLRESGVNAFFTRSSAANIPVNMAIAKRLGLDEETYSISIPLGASISMAGASITITVLTLAAVNTLGISVDVPTAILLSLVATLCACGASGVAGGSLLLVPVACTMFGIPNDVAMHFVAVGYIIGVLQDSSETALNSSTDLLFTIAVCQGRKAPDDN